MKYLSSVSLSLLAFAITYGSQTTFGQPAGGENLIVRKTDDFILTGSGSADNWSATEWIDLPQRNSRDSFRGFDTRLKLMYSDTGLYFLFSCDDQILTSTMNEDFMKLWKEDVVEVFLWPDVNDPLYFEYELSPLNYELPLLISNEQGDLARWMPFMYEADRQTRHLTAVEGGRKESGASITKWSAEFFIPYKLLRPLNNIQPSSGTIWRANFYRVDYDEGSIRYIWKAIESSFHEPDKFGIIVFE